MNATQIWSWVTGAGSIVGLLTGLWVLSDRLSRGRPYAAWIGMERQTATLEFINTSDRYLYLDRLTCWPHARATRFEELRESLADHWYIERTIVLAPRDQCTTRVTWSGSLPPRGLTLVIVRWRRAGGLFALPVIKVARWDWLSRFQERDPTI
jgi:hypothetical protein